MTPNQEPVERDWIETWKLDLERLLWSYHENGRPDGKTGVIGNPKTIQEFVEKLISGETERIVKIAKSLETWHYENASPLIFREDLLRKIKETL